MARNDSAPAAGGEYVTNWTLIFSAAAGLLGIAGAVAAAVCLLPWGRAPHPVPQRDAASDAEATVHVTASAEPAVWRREAEADHQPDRVKRFELPARPESPREDPPAAQKRNVGDQAVKPDPAVEVTVTRPTEPGTAARLQPRDWKDLYVDLEHFGVVDLDGAWAERYPAALMTARESRDPLPVLNLYRKQTAGLTLPRLEGEDCVTKQRPAQVKGLVAMLLRSVILEESQIHDPGAFLEDRDSYSRRAKKVIEPLERWKSRVEGLDMEAEPVSIMEQMLAAEGRHLRYILVSVLAEYDNAAAARALARRGVYDLDREVREYAWEALRRRWQADPSRVEEIRGELLDALRYPWPPIAEHAAETLVALNDTRAVGELVDLLDEPDPNAPFQHEHGHWMKRQLVRVNHLRNCYLCHAPANVPEEQLPGEIARVLDSRDSEAAPPVDSLSRRVRSRVPRLLRGEILGTVPVPGSPLPPPQEYYSQRLLEDMVVRADVVYLRQDFSLSHRVPHDGKWPEYQRFDYFVCLRPLTESEAAALEHEQNSPPAEPANYPQREAVLFALRELTGENPGDSTQAWREWLGRQK